MVICVYYGETMKWNVPAEYKRRTALKMFWQVPLIGLAPSLTQQFFSAGVAGALIRSLCAFDFKFREMRRCL